MESRIPFLLCLADHPSQALAVLDSLTRMHHAWTTFILPRYPYDVCRYPLVSKPTSADPTSLERRRNAVPQEKG